MPSKPPDDPNSKNPDDPSLKAPKEKSKPTKKEDGSSLTKKYIQLIQRMSKRNKNEKEKKDPDNPFDIKKAVEIKRPQEEELKKKLSELSLKIEKLKRDTSVLHKTAAKTTSLETSAKQKKEKCSIGNKKYEVKEKSYFKIPLPQSIKGTSGQSFISKIQLYLTGFRLQGGKSSPPQGTNMSAPGRPMKFPYTYSSKIAQFPLKFYVKNNWMWRYYFIAIAVSFPLFYKIGRLSNSPENVKKWEDIRKRDFTAGGHH